MSLRLGEREARFIDALAHFDQYLGVWMIEEAWFRQRIALLSLGGLEDHIRVQQQQAESAASVSPPEPIIYEVMNNGIAVMEVRGALTKYGSSLSANAGTVRMARGLRELSRDDAVRGILMIFESPGGTTAGTAELADVIADVNRRKPVHAFIEDLGASAAYWLASQSERITANRMAQVGSIGTMIVVRDYSEADRRIGIRTHVIATGPFKGAGVPGTEVTPEHLAEAQRTVNDLNEVFLRSVAKGRGLTMAEVRAVADGRVHIATGARDLKLIDAVGTLDEATTALLQAVRARAAGGSSPTGHRSSLSSQSVEAPLMSDTPTSTAPTPAPAPSSPPSASSARPASLSELKSACPGAGPEFLMAQLEANATVDQARTAWTQHLVNENASLQQRLAAGPTSSTGPAPAPTPTPRPGVSTLGSIRPGGAGAGAAAGGGSSEDDVEIDADKDPIGAWNALIETEMRRNGNNKPLATKAVVAAYPDLHRAYVVAYNERHKQQREEEERIRARRSVRA